MKISSASDGACVELMAIKSAVFELVLNVFTTEPARLLTLLAFADESLKVHGLLTPRTTGAINE